jgi:hypothetical protein
LGRYLPHFAKEIPLDPPFIKGEVRVLPFYKAVRQEHFGPERLDLSSSTGLNAEGLAECGEVRVLPEGEMKGLPPLKKGSRGDFFKLFDSI